MLNQPLEYNRGLGKAGFNTGQFKRLGLQSREGLFSAFDQIFPFVTVVLLNRNLKPRVDRTVFV